MFESPGFATCAPYVFHGYVACSIDILLTLVFGNLCMIEGAGPGLVVALPRLGLGSSMFFCSWTTVSYRGGVVFGCFAACCLLHLSCFVYLHGDAEAVATGNLLICCATMGTSLLHPDVDSC